jgi:hypothetical protein
VLDLSTIELAALMGGLFACTDKLRTEMQTGDATISIDWSDWNDSTEDELSTGLDR